MKHLTLVLLFSVLMAFNSSFAIAQAPATAADEAGDWPTGDALRAHVLGVVQPKIVRPEEPYAHWRISVPDAAAGGAIELHLWSRGRRVVA
jgi:hypothetical protein